MEVASLSAYACVCCTCLHFFYVLMPVEWLITFIEKKITAIEWGWFNLKDPAEPTLSEYCRVHPWGGRSQQVLLIRMMKCWLWPWTRTSGQFCDVISSFYFISRWLWQQQQVSFSDECSLWLSSSSTLPTGLATSTFFDPWSLIVTVYMYITI